MKRRIGLRIGLVKKRIGRIVTVVVLLGVAAPASAQVCLTYTPPYPNGCSIPFVPLFVANGLDFIFLGACNSHDNCYGTRNPVQGPCLDSGLRHTCDASFLAHMEAICVFYSGLLAYPASGWEDADDFFEDCTSIAGVFYGAVVAGGFDAFRRRQCCIGCNREMCNSLGELFPAICPRPGCGTAQPPPPPPPPPPPCDLGMANTRTWIVAPNGATIPAPEQTGRGLERFEGRPGTSIFMDEWALVSVGREGTGVERTSAGSFGWSAALAASGSMPVYARKGTILVVEAAGHQRNGREIPAPFLVPFEVEIGSTKLLRTKDLWFRAEVDPGGRVDRVTLLDPPTEPVAADVEHLIRRHLALGYVDERRHRTVVYGLARIDDRGLLSVREDEGLVVVPQCCCDGEPLPFPCIARNSGEQ